MAKGVKTGGRKPGTPNKVTAELKDVILKALDGAGGQKYLEVIAVSHPAAFLGLVGKVLPMTISGTGANDAIVVEITRFGSDQAA